MLLKTKLITTGIVAATTIVGGLSCLNFDGSVLTYAIKYNDRTTTSAVNTINKAEDIIREEHNKVVSLSKTIKELNTKIEELQNKLDITLQNGEKDKEKIKKIESQMKKLRSDKDTLQQQLTVLQEKKVASDERSEKLEKQVKEAKDKMNKFEITTELANKKANANKTKANNYFNAFQHEYDQVNQANEFIKEKAINIKDNTDTLIFSINKLDDIIDEVQS